MQIHTSDSTASVTPVCIIGILFHNGNCLLFPDVWHTGGATTSLLCGRCCAATFPQAIRIINTTSALITSEDGRDSLISLVCVSLLRRAVRPTPVAGKHAAIPPSASRGLPVPETAYHRLQIELSLFYHRRGAYTMTPVYNVKIVY